VLRRPERARARRLLAGLLLLGAAPLPARAAPPAPVDVVRMWEVARTSDRPQRLVMDLHLVVRGEYATLWVISRNVPGTSWLRADSLYAEYGTGAPRWYSTQYPVPHSPPCQDTLLCEDPRPNGYIDGYHIDTNELNGGKPVASTYYVVTSQSNHALETTINISPGWRMRPISTGFRIVRADTSYRTTGVHYGSQAVEVYRGASAPGGRYGSIAFAVIPCNPLMGVGSASLAGGEPLYPDTGVMTCSSPPRPMTSADATGPTTWRVDGEVIGETPSNNRLVVFDYPKP
jgi:hypothetical protein